MHRSVKQTQPKNNNAIITVCIVITICAVMFGLGQREDAQMARYAQANNCTWVATGTLYGDNRDYVCN